MMNQFINEVEVRKAIEQLHGDDELFEVRVINSTFKKPISGYFKDADTMLKKFNNIRLDGSNVYITLNQIDEALFSRVQSENFVMGATSTGDANVVGYRWLFIDLDPVRATGVSSTDDELKAAFDLARQVAEHLRNLGFEEPVKGMSGNGAHLLYRVQLANNEENEGLIERCLKALSMLFDNDQVKVDTSNYNPSRVCKLYGTIAQKGKSTKTRPFRFSRIYGDARECKVTDKGYLEKLAAELPSEQIKPERGNNYRPNDFDIESWMDKYGIRYTAKEWNGGTKYVLDECPFDSSHKAPDSMVTKSATGAIGFKCLHNSCAHYKWQDLRIKFEPDAYNISDDEIRITEGYLRHNKEREEELAKRQNVKVTESEPLFLNAAMISEMNVDEAEYIQTGIRIIDKRMKGLERGCVSVVSGLRGAAKSTILSEIILNTIQRGGTSICYSGELSSQRFMKWMYMQAAGKAYTRPYELYEGYFCPEEVKPNIDKWMGDLMWLYNNHYGNNFFKIGECLRSEITKRKADLCIVDNLMALDLTTFDMDKYEAQTKFVWELKDIAESCNVHIIFVAHPRKAMGFLRLDDISGSGNIANIVDYAFIIHRNNADFQRLTKQMFGWKDDAEVYTGTNVIEVCKDRDNGNQDLFIPLWYEKETKRLLNDPNENIVYSWEKLPVDTDKWEIPFD